MCSTSAGQGPLLDDARGLPPDVPGAARAGARGHAPAGGRLLGRRRVHGLNQVSTVGAVLLGASTLPFLWNALQTWRGRLGRVAGDDPWEGHTLEWATTSPPAPENFTAPLPPIRSQRPVWDLHHGAPGRPGVAGGDGRSEGDRATGDGGPSGGSAAAARRGGAVTGPGPETPGPDRAAAPRPDRAGGTEGPAGHEAGRPSTTARCPSGCSRSSGCSSRCWRSSTGRPPTRRPAW